MRRLPLMRQVKNASSAVVAKVYAMEGRRSAIRFQFAPQPLATMACQISSGGLVLRVPTNSLCKGSQWPDSAVMRAMWI